MEKMNEPDEPDEMNQSRPKRWRSPLRSITLALLNAVECPIHLNGPSQHSAVKYFCIIDHC